VFQVIHRFAWLCRRGHYAALLNHDFELSSLRGLALDFLYDAVQGELLKVRNRHLLGALFGLDRRICQKVRGRSPPCT
jgi:hypothetical protein